MSSPNNASGTLDPETQKEMAQFLEVEQSRAQLQQAVHRFTDMCWDKCVKNASTPLDHGEESCFVNCVGRFLDTSVYLVKNLDSAQNL
ncbi:Mitochondrial import inner membrane translocase subunit tim8 [Dispira simplex]|nr:Mitochondrial import inner membrane translocase subunit tim8 [Dispira simplex]